MPAPWSAPSGTGEVPQVGDGRPERRVVDRHADHQAEREQAVDERALELGRRREVRIQMQRLRIHRHRREQDVVGLRDGARPRVVERHADAKLFVVETGHFLWPWAPRRRWRVETAMEELYGEYRVVARV